MSTNTRKRIMEAAKELFSLQGYAAVTTKEIANKSNTSEVTLFRYFESKRNLFNCIVKEQMHTYGLSEYFTSLKTYDVRRDLLHVANIIKKSYSDNGDLIRMMLKDVIFDSEDIHHTKQKKNMDANTLYNYFKEISTQGLIKEDPKKSMIFFMSNVNSFGMRSYVLKNNLKDEKDDYFEWMVSRIIDVITKE